MYICICHALTDRDVEAAREEGARTENDVFAHFGIRPECGSCLPELCCRMRQAEKDAPSPAVAAQPVG